MGNIFWDMNTADITVPGFGPPSNDACENAPILTSFPHALWGTTATATNDGYSYCGDIGGRDVYYRIAPQHTGAWRLRLCNFSPLWDSVIAVHTSCPAGLLNTVPGGCDDDGCGTFAGLSVLDVFLQAGHDYIVRVGTYQAGPPGGPFYLTIDRPTTPPNDYCEGAEELPCGVPVIADTSEATVWPVDPNLPCRDPGSSQLGSLWYKFVLTTPNVRLTTCSTNAGDSVLALYGTTDPNNPCSELSLIACNEDAGCGPNGWLSTVTASNLVVGTTVYAQLAVWGAGDLIPYTLLLECLPGNDTCQAALPLVCGQTVEVDTALATTSESDPAMSCRDGGSSQQGSLWYQFIATSPTARLTTCESDIGDSELAIYRRTNPALPCSTLVEIACNEDAGCGPNGWLSAVTATGLTVGETYYAQLAVWGGGDLVSYSLTLDCRPDNDACADAFAIGDTTVSGYNTDATIDGTSTCGAATWAPEVWYAYTAPRTGRASAETIAADFDTVVSVHSDCPGSTFNTIACNDDFGQTESLAQFDCVAGTTYYIRVAGHNGAMGTFTLRTISAPPPPPNPNGVIPGLDVRYYSLTNATVLPDYDALLPYAYDVTARIDYPPTNGTFANSGRTDQVGARFDGYFISPATARYTFGLESDDGSRLRLNGALLVDNDGLHAMQERTATIDLAAGTYPIRVDFFEAGGGAGVILRVTGGGSARQVAPSASLVYTVRPPNDDCNRALPVSLGQTAHGTTRGAVADGSGGTGSCAVTGPDVWYAFAAPCTGFVRLDACNANFAAAIWAYSACPGTASTLVGCSGSSCNFPLPVVLDHVYYVRICGASGGSGDFLLSAAQVMQLYDRCEFGVLHRIYDGVTRVGNCNATTDGPPASCGEAFNDVWYVYQATCTGVAAISICAYDWNPLLVAYSGTSCPVTAARQLACNDDSCGLGPRITFPVTQNTPYLVRLASHDAFDSGSGDITVSCAPPTPGDLDGDGDVDLTDLANMLINFGTPSGATRAMGDEDGDGDVDLVDLATLLANFGTVRP